LGEKICIFEVGLLLSVATLKGCVLWNWSLSSKFGQQMSLLVSVVLMRTWYVMAVVTVTAIWGCGAETGNGVFVNNRFIFYMLRLCSLVSECGATCSPPTFEEYKYKEYQFTE
jgi:hypothetical protein